MLFSVTREWRETLARMDEPGAVAPLHGWISLDKPYGLGSTQAVGAVKRCLREAGLRQEEALIRTWRGRLASTAQAGR